MYNAMHRPLFTSWTSAQLRSPNAGGVDVCRVLYAHTCSLYILSRALHNVLGTSVTQVSSVAVHGDLIKIHERVSLRLRVAPPRDIQHYGYFEGVPSGQTSRLSTYYPSQFHPSHACYA